MPIAQLRKQVPQVLGRRASGLLGIQPIVVPLGLLQSILLATKRNKLPHPRRCHVRHRARRKSALRLRQIDQLLRNALFGQNLRNHRLIATGPLEPIHQRAAAALRRKVIDKTLHRVVHHQRKLRLRQLWLQPGNRFSLGIHGQRDFADFVQRRLFEYRLLQLARAHLQVKPVDPVDQVFEFLLQACPVRRALGGGQQ